MRRQAKALLPTALRSFEQRVHERLFGRPAEPRSTPRYGSDPQAMAALIERLESQGLLVRVAGNGVEIDDLTLRTSYYYGIASLPAGEQVIGALLVRSALFALTARRALHVTGVTPARPTPTRTPRPTMRTSRAA